MFILPTTKKPHQAKVRLHCLSAWFICIAYFCRFLSDALKCVLSDFNDLWAIVPTKGLKFVREDVREVKINCKLF